MPKSHAPQDSHALATLGLWLTRLFEGFPPGQNVLVNTVHERAVQVEQERRTTAFGFHGFP